MSVAVTPRSSSLLLAALGLALLADLLLRGAAWGINLGLLALAIGGTGAGLGRGGGGRLRRSAGPFALAAIGFALLFALRDSDDLKWANGIALVLCLGAALMPKGGRSLRESSVVELAGGVTEAIGALPVEATTLAGTAREIRFGSPEARGRSRALGRGLLLALPLLLVFGGLFASADAVFRRSIDDAFRVNFDLGAFWAHFWTFASALTLVGGILHRAFRERPARPPVVRPSVEVPFGPVPYGAMPPGPFAGPPAPPAPARPKGLGIIETGTVLGSLVLLFAAFVAVQFRYLFGAAETVRATVGLSYSEYARAGFFELAWTAILAMVVILGADASLRREGPRDDAVFRWLGRGLVALVLLVVLSAMTRMRAYTDFFGLTELRVYTSVFMGWLTLAFVLMLFTTLAGRPRRFAFGGFVAGLLTIFVTNLMNPDRLIVRTNLLRPRADFAYMRTLSDDAILALRDLSAAIPAAHRAEAAALVASRRAALARGDWRELNLARAALAR